MKYPLLIVWELGTQKLIQSRNRLYLAKLDLTRFLFLEGLSMSALEHVADMVELFPLQTYEFAARRIRISKLRQLQKRVAAVARATLESGRHLSNIPRPLQDCFFIGAN